MAQKVGEIYYDVTLDTGQMIGQQRDVDRAIDASVLKFNALTAAVKILAAAYAMVKSAQLADEFRMLASRVEVAAGSIQRGAEAMRELEAISRRTQTAVADNAAVFNRLNQSLLQMGGTQQDTLKLTELLGKAVKVSGASTVEASAAMLQFGQALGSGKLAGDELRSLMETAPYLMRQLADGIGVPVGALKEMGEEGKLTADVVVNALSKAAGQIDADFQKFPQTIGAAMAVATDAALKLNAKLDDLTGTSTALAGVAKGLGTVFDTVSNLLGNTSKEADALGRNRRVQEWANSTATVLTYVADAADFVTRMFQQTGVGIGGMAAAAAAAARGDLSGAGQILGQVKNDIMAIGNAQYFGDKMRNQFKALENIPEMDRLDRLAAGLGGMSQLKAPKAEDGKTKAKKQPFDALGYLAGLSSKAAAEWDRVGIVEAEAMRKNDELLKKKDITAKQHEEARVLIAAEATKQREKLMAQETEDFLKEMSDRYQREQMLKERAEREERSRQTGRKQAKVAISEAKDDPVERIRAEEQRKLDEMDAFRARDLENTALYEEAKLAIRKQAADQEKAIQDQSNISSLNMATNLADSMYQLLEKSGKEKTALGKALFLASKAMAVAEIIMNTEVAAAKAGAQLGIFGIPMATMIRATGYASAGMVAGMAVAEVTGGRQYGGPVSSGNLYRVNETGKPEMFTAANGAQYMMPTTGGRVTAADNIGGSAQWSIVVNNTAQGTMATASVDQTSQTITIAVREVASQIRSNTGPVWSALKSSTNISSRL